MSCFQPPKKCRISKTFSSSTLKGFAMTYCLASINPVFKELSFDIKLIISSISNYSVIPRAKYYFQPCTGVSKNVFRSKYESTGKLYPVSFTLKKYLLKIESEFITTNDTLNDHYGRYSYRPYSNFRNFLVFEILIDTFADSQ